MSQQRRVGSGDIPALDEDDGVVQPVGADGYVTLGVDTYLFVIGGSADSPLESVHIQTDATIAWSNAYIETCNFPPYKGGAGSGTVDTTDWDTATVGAWIKEDPTTAYIATTGTGWTVTNASMAKTAGTGGAMLHLGNLGSKRARLRLIVTTGGKVRVNAHGKD